MSLQLESPPRVQTRHAVTLIAGDGVGPEVANATREILHAAGAAIDWEEAEAGKRVFEAGVASGVPTDTLDSLSRTKVALKGPLETPVGHGGKSANVTLRKLFETFGNIRPVRELPGIQTPFSGRGIDLIVVRENVEDLYAGIEHHQTPDVAQCLKLISVKGCQKIARLAFEIARSEGRTSVHAATKANIMKLTEGMLKREFENVAEDYPEIAPKHVLIDNCAHQLVIKPEQFDVIVTTNMNGDIISDLTSGLVGGLGLAPSANLGHDFAMFEAVHGAAPDIAGQDKANPTALLLSAVMMLRHLGEFDIAQKVEDALMVTLSEAKALPGDIAAGRPVCGTRAFADSIIDNLGRAVTHSEPARRAPVSMPSRPKTVALRPTSDILTQGMDVFIQFEGAPDVLGSLLEEAADKTGFKLKMISNRGTQVYPSRGTDTDCVDHWRCRFLGRVTPASVSTLLDRVETNGLRWMHIEKLHEINGAVAYTKAQGED